MARTTKTAKQKSRRPERASRDASTCMPRCCTGFGPFRVRAGLLWLINYNRRVRVASQVLRLRSQLSQSCCLSLVLRKSSRVYLFFPPRGHKPPPTFYDSTHTFACNAVAFQSPAMPNTWMSLCTQSVYSFSFPPSPPHCTLNVSQHDSLW